MKRVLFLMMAVLVVLSTVSAEIILNENPDEVYNLGDVVKVPVTVKATEDTSDTLSMTLICGAKQTKFFENGVELNTGEEAIMEGILNKEKIGFQTGDCRIKVALGADYIFTDYFKFSNLLILQSSLDSTTFNPGQSVVFKGTVVRETGDDVNGFITLSVSSGNNSSNIERLSTVSNGYFSINVTLPENIEAGNHVVHLFAYEVNSEEVETNKGFLDYNIVVNQVPTSLEIIADSFEVNPGSVLKVKAILHDQTGESIDSVAIISLKKSKNEIVQQTELSTDSFLEYEVDAQEEPANWTVVGVSNKLTSEIKVSILENKEVSVSFVNGTVLVENVGNVPYNDSVLIKIGENSTLEFDVFLEVGDSKEYELRAPDGEYIIEVISDGKSQFKDSVLLTGKAVDVKESSSGWGVVKFIVWIFIIIVLGFVVYLVFKKGYQRSFFGKFKKKDNVKVSSEPVKPKKSPEFLMKTHNRAILSLSIKGDKHNAAVACLKIKNFDKLKMEGVEESLGRIAAVAEGSKAFIYENSGNVFFIFSALKTRTFKNEKSAIELSNKIVEILKHHNKLFKERIDYGLALDEGEIVARVSHHGILEFMAMGNLIPSLKRISDLSSGEIFLGKKFRDKAGSLIKSDEKEIDGKKVYTIREVRDRDQHKKFITNFLHGLEKDKQERERRNNN